MAEGALAKKLAWPAKVPGDKKRSKTPHDAIMLTKALFIFIILRHITKLKTQVGKRLRIIFRILKNSSIIHPMKKPLILIDGSSYLYRAFHALPALTNSQGEPTGAIYGVLSMVRKLITDYDPQYVAIVFDSKEKTFRDQIYPAYKAHRPPMPQELVGQIKPLHDTIHAMGIPLVVIEGVEADDVIATLATQAEQQGINTLISTGDKDMAQLVNDHITLINTMSDTKLDRAGVMHKFGVPPEQIVDYLALMGDSSDNIPGVPNVGPKTAAKWLKQYGSLKGIMAHAHEIPGKVGENLRHTLDKLPLSQTLTTLQRHAPEVKFAITDLIKKPPQREKLFALFKQLEFKTWLKELLTEAGEEPITRDYQTILTKGQLREWLERLKKASYFAFDTETTDLNALAAQLVGVSFAITPNQAAYVPLGHDYLGAPTQLSREYVLEQLKPLLADSSKLVIGQNLKYDMEVLAHYGLTITAPYCDTMLESYVLDSTSNRHDLDSLALKHLGRQTITYEAIAGKGQKQLSFNQIPLEAAASYAAEDADVTLQLHQLLWPKIAASDDLKCVLMDIELPLIPVLSRIERYGVMIDSGLLAQQSKELALRIHEIEEEIFKMAGRVFNVSSPKQLQEVLYNQLQLPILSKTPTGAPSTAEAVLQELALDYPLPQIILEHRSLCKIKSTYTDSLPKQINPKSGRVHTSYNQAITSTGRLSSTDPNLQNIPIRSEEGRRIRQAFIAPPGYKIVSADYSQIELRIMAHLSQDPGLLKAFAEEQDIHTATAAEVFNIPLSAVTPEQRRQAKAINFGLIYGMSAFGLSRQLGIDRSIAQVYMDQYFDRFPGVKLYMEAIRAMAQQQGYVETLLGRRLYVPEIRSSQMQRRRAAERAAINAPMQGTAADIIKIAMINLDAWINTAELDVKMIMQVHDELVFEVAEQDLKPAVTHIQKAMTQAVTLDTPLIVHTGIGNNWDEAH